MPPFQPIAADSKSAISSFHIIIIEICRLQISMLPIKVGAVFIK